MKTISFFNLKGGCGKTTSVINLSQQVAEQLGKVLLIDCDIQSNLTNSLMDYDINRPCLYHLLTEEKSINEVIYPVTDQIDIIPSSLLMSTIEPRLASIYGREFMLLRAIKELEKDYDYCLLDCAPSFGLVTTNAIVISDSIIVPVQTEYYAVDGVHLLDETLEYINKSLGLDKEITFLFATLHDKRNNLNNIQYESLKDSFGDKFLNTFIRKNIALAESPIYKQSIFEYRKSSHGAQDYENLFNELVKKGGF
jgi:chromosome partitioning protein